jgi:hypothetical protein
MWNVRKQSRGEERKESYVECEEAEQRTGMSAMWNVRKQSRGEEGVICGM